jgi:hypothetical protein
MKKQSSHQHLIILMVDCNLTYQNTDTPPKTLYSNTRIVSLHRAGLIRLLTMRSSTTLGSPLDLLLLLASVFFRSVSELVLSGDKGDSVGEHE